MWGSNMFYNAGKIRHKSGPSFLLLPIHSDMQQSIEIVILDVTLAPQGRAKEDVFDIPFKHHELCA